MAGVLQVCVGRKHTAIFPLIYRLSAAHVVVCGSAFAAIKNSIPRDPATGFVPVVTRAIPRSHPATCL